MNTKIIPEDKNMNIQVSAVLLLCVSTLVHADQLRLVGDFDTQVQYLLDYEFLKPEQLLNMTKVYDDVSRTLEQKWPGIKIYPSGSLVIGLAAKFSDVDFIVKVQNYNNSSELYLATQALGLFYRQPELYTLVEQTASEGGVPLITLYHILTKRFCDISFASHTSSENSQLLGYYFKLDQRNLALSSLLKFWSKVHASMDIGIVRNYVLYLLIVFYLQQRDLVPPVSSLQVNLGSSSTDNWATFTKIPYNSSNTESLYQLLGGFFKYYSEFNYKDNIIVPFVGKVIPRSVFKNDSSIPEEFAEYESYINRVKSKSIELESAMCILDVFEQSSNVADTTTPEQFGWFVHRVKFGAKVFQEVSSDCFLTAILTRDAYDNEILENIDEIITRGDCTY